MILWLEVHAGAHGPRSNITVDRGSFFFISSLSNFYFFFMPTVGTALGLFFGKLFGWLECLMFVREILSVHGNLFWLS